MTAAAELLDRAGWSWVRRFGDVLGPSASLVGTTVVTSALGFAYWWAAARMAPIREVGAATAVISSVTLLGTIGMFGFGTMLIAEAGRCRDAVGSLIATSLLAVTALATALAALSWAALRFSHGAVGADMASPWVAAGFIAGVGLTAAGMVLDQALVGIRASSVQFYRNSYFSVVKLVLLVLLAVAVGGHSPVTMVWAWVAGIVISMVATARHLAARGYRLGQPVRLSALRGRGVTTFHHNTLNLSLSLPRLGLPLLVASLLGAHATAAFYEAWMIASFLYILPTHLSTALFAVAVGDSRALAPRLRAALRVSLVLGGSAAVAIAALAGPAMRSFGPGYEIARTALIVMAIAYFPNVFKQCYVAVARVDNRLRKAGAVCSAGAALEVCLTGVAGRLDGLTGISLGFLAAVTLQALYYVPRVMRALRPGGQHAAPRRSSRARRQHAGSSAPSSRRAGRWPRRRGQEHPGRSVAGRRECSHARHIGVG
jgi:O-antigen/teichoic acid export membrane protein